MIFLNSKVPMLRNDRKIVCLHNLPRRTGGVNDVFRKHGLKMNLDKTDVMWVGKQREELNIMLEGKDITQVVCIWVEIYLRTGEWRCDVECKQERMHGEM